MSVHRSSRILAGDFSMSKFILPSLVTIAAFAVPAQAAVLGPTPYTSQADSPFTPGNFDYFFLEDVEDDLINTPGLAVAGPNLCIAGTLGCFPRGLTDSVGNGGNPNIGRSIFTIGMTTITFDAMVLGSLPTAAGLVWTDGNNPITFQAFDQNNMSLGIVFGNHATAGVTGQIDEDRFYGATNAGGILRLVISNPPGTEIDHIQYGGGRVAAIPQPASWALMIVGFGVIGGAMRRRNRGGHVSFSRTTVTN